MCGLVGFWQPGGIDAGPARARVRAMAAAIAARGPDDEGAWVDGDAGVALGHRRLSIVDLSPAGHQPMVSADGRWVLVFNGEIYNHAELRAQLDAGADPPAWRGHSDTETLLAAVVSWGLAEALRRSVGMFALALWDRRERRLLLARDRLGEKPLYHGLQRGPDGTALLFGSELKALRLHPAYRRSDDAIDVEALALYMRLGYVAGPHSIQRGIAKLTPGCIAVYRAPDAPPDIEAYWSAQQVILGAEPARVRPARMPTIGEAADRLEQLLGDAVRQQMVADVPLGAFLSGGVDSSTVVALMQRASGRPVRTFSIGFHEAEYNEAEHAKAVARHLGTDHEELYVTADEALDVVPALPRIYDEPFADSSQIPTWLVSRMARRHVTVSLSGDAGDELFGGYTRYDATQRLWAKLQSIPRPVRHAAARLVPMLSVEAWNRVGHVLHAATGGRRYNRFGEKLHKAVKVFGSMDAGELYRQLVSQWPDPQHLVPGAAREAPTLLGGVDSPLHGLADVERMMACDLLTYLPDDILVKVDRAAMAVSLETRVPMLDHRVVEFAWTLPMTLRLDAGVTKRVLREVLARHVPRTLFERPKMGFGVPIGRWLRGPLRDWAEDLLSPSSLQASGLLDAGPIRSVWAEHLSGRADQQYPLWTILMFQAWWRAQRDDAAAVAAA